MKKTLFLFIIMGIVVLIVGLGALVYLNIKKNDSKVPVNVISNELPLELSEDFDPTVNTPVFKVVSIDGEKKLLELQYLFPHSKENERVVSIVTCDTAKVVGEIVGVSEMFRFLSENIKKNIVFVGLCGDVYCKNVSSRCEVDLVEIRSKAIKQQ